MILVTELEFRAEISPLSFWLLGVGVEGGNKGAAGVVLHEAASLE